MSWLKKTKKRNSRNVNLAFNESILPKVVLLSAEVIPEYESTGDGGGYFPSDSEVAMTEAAATADHTWDQAISGGGDGWDQSGDGGGDWGNDLDIPGSGSMISDSIDWILENGWDDAVGAEGGWDQTGDGGGDWGDATGVEGDWGPGDGGGDWGPPPFVGPPAPEPQPENGVYIDPKTGWRYDYLDNGVIVGTPPWGQIILPDQESHGEYHVPPDIPPYHLP